MPDAMVWDASKSGPGYVYGDFDLYFQPGGCMEVGQSDGHGDRDFVHFCPDEFGLLESAVEMWRAHPNGPKS